MKKIITFFFFVSVALNLSAQYKVRGDVVYASNVQTYLDSCVIQLKQGSIVIAQVNSDALGHYEISNIANGTYTLTGTCSKTWGGCNSNDALLIMKHTINMSPLTGYKKDAADVNNSQSINALDASIAARRFVHLITSFPAGDWLIASASITVSNGNVNHNLRGICKGDVNASFLPPAVFTCGNYLIDSRDGKSYPTVRVGDQCWMAKNLNYGSFIYGVGNQSNNYVTEKYCYENDTNNCNIYGGWYQWQEMMNYTTTEGGQGICPNGWHVPTDDEWDTLVTITGGADSAGVALKSGGSSGFNALMSGWVKNCKKYSMINLKTNFWSSTNILGENAWTRVLDINSTTVIQQSTTPFVEGISLRCIKD
ncbi:MAG: FISUMP domain-containing protein [Bacteroidota bacterium]